MTPHPPDSLANAFHALRLTERTDGPVELVARLDLLKRLEVAVLGAKERIVQAAAADFGARSREETLFGEVLGVVSALRHAHRHVRRWSRPRRVPVGAPFWPAKAWLVPQPLGLVGIMSPWNYPFLLALSPLVGALAAGNRAMLKPSEHTPRVAAEIAQLLDRSLGQTIVRTVEGGPTIARAFASLRFDHLIFTGSTARGREVAMAAAANLVPVTLELGGKCPAIVLPDADLDAAASAIVTGKGLNAGQTCIAPDHVLLAGVPGDRFRAALEAAVQRHFPDGLTTRIIPHRAGQFGGPEGMLQIVVDPPPSSPLVTEEVFGPVLPIHALPDLDAALDRLRDQDSPLAVYLFSRDPQAERRVLQGTRAGALVVGGTIVQAAIDELPFGGLGASGMGRYHGQAGFDALSNLKAHVRTPRFSLASLGQPPYGKFTAKLLAHLLPDPK
ncbi:MAG TPA: aldehyde dehydrogenase family protein [Geminicoccus sp.]|jgi:coniferyl-aldehyde dehydrogenase|uniref:aldehyde dehydrogenase family protein n=1 Tax=Geminicoccus sp. TaxID=2024832 RepID=UPI002E3655A9|nr:aldehyde dehydrogenase family protein [Geminicoccus sp.]HEX2528892.1 aldehyde dehydrogenase family protein [Geminicoccus sp.]